MIRTRNQAGTRSSKWTLPNLIYQIVSSVLITPIPFLPSENRYNITISNQKKFIWFRVAKAGTRSIFDIFDRANVILDAEEPINCYYPPNLYRSYFKFAFVRNPWDRLVSCWHNKVVESNHFKFTNDELSEMQNFENFVSHVAGIDVNRCDNHIRSQSKMIDLNNINYVGRFENFNSDLSEVMNILGIENTPIGKKNESKRQRDYRDYYNAETREKVARVYSKDINIFSYKF